MMMTTAAIAARPRKARKRDTRIDPSSITESQLLAMPEADYMGDVQLAFFKASLLMLEQMLLARARGADIAISAGSAGADPVDRASAEEEHTLALTGRARDAAQLLEVRAAMKRIEDGEFGYCRETGDEIGVARLLICPTAVLTKEAQERQENHRRRFRLPGVNA